LTVRSRDQDGFNSAEAGWLEGRLWDILDSAPAAKLVGKKGDDQTLPKHQRDELEQFLAPVTAVLRALAASPDTPDPQLKRRRAKKHATIADLIRAELLPSGARLRSIASLHEAVAHVRADGQLSVAGQVYDSPSGAAVAVVGHETNGWKFWGAPSGDGRLVPLAELRKRLDPSAPEDGEPPALPTEARPTATRATGALKQLVDAGFLTGRSTVWGKHRGVRREATVDGDGFLHLAGGGVHKSPSGAAVEVTGGSTNGWRFWHVDRGDTSVSLDELRAPRTQDG
jgi:Restriction Enzyme Adenine Methylase Associated